MAVHPSFRATLALFIAHALVASLALAACGGGVHPGGDGSMPGDDGSTAHDAGVDMPAPGATVEAPLLLLAADPKLDGFTTWPLAFVVSPYAPSLTCAVTLARGTTNVATLTAPVMADGTCTATWDGRDPAGMRVPTGPLDVTTHVVGGSGVYHGMLEVVRLGATQMTLEGTVPAHDAPLLYSASEHVRGHFFEVAPTDPIWALAPDATEPATAVPLELADGTPRPAPTLPTDMLSPPLDANSMDGIEHDTYSLPHAFVAGTDVVAHVVLDAHIANGGSAAPMATEVHVVAPTGTTITGSDAFMDGATVSFTTTSSPVPSVARYNLAWDLGYAVRAPGGTLVAMPGRTRIQIRLYGLVAQPAMRGTASPEMAWVDVVDAIAQWVDGTASDDVGVGGAIVDNVFHSLGLRYDRMSGASAYTDYPGPGWSNAVYYAAQFQDRGYGSVINCSDAASIVSTYSNMIGASRNYHILATADVLADPGGTGGFDLNYIEGIGSTTFSRSPFTSGRASFRYHAVTGPDLATFYDATLALDGDADPTTLPATFLLAEGLPAAEYIMRLSSDAPGVVMAGMNEKVVLR